MTGLEGSIFWAEITRDVLGILSAISFFFPTLRQDRLRRLLARIKANRSSNKDLQTFLDKAGTVLEQDVMVSILDKYDYMCLFGGVLLLFLSFGLHLLILLLS